MLCCPKGLIMSKPKGTTAHCVSNIRSIDVVITWKETKVVSLLSTIAAVNPVNVVNRFNRKEKSVEVNWSNIIQRHIRHMDSVNLLDGLLGAHKKKLKIRKWYTNLTIVNAWLFNKIIQKQDNSFMSMIDFREEFCLCLC